MITQKQLLNVLQAGEYEALEKLLINAKIDNIPGELLLYRLDFFLAVLGCNDEDTKVKIECLPVDNYEPLGDAYIFRDEKHYYYLSLVFVEMNGELIDVHCSKNMDLSAVDERSECLNFRFAKDELLDFIPAEQYTQLLKDSDAAIEEIESYGSVINQSQFEAWETKYFNTSLEIEQQMKEYAVFDDFKSIYQFISDFSTRQKVSKSANKVLEELESARTDEDKLIWLLNKKRYANSISGLLNNRYEFRGYDFELTSELHNAIKKAYFAYVRTYNEVCKVFGLAVEESEHLDSMEYDIFWYSKFKDLAEANKLPFSVEVLNLAKEEFSYNPFSCR